MQLYLAPMHGVLDHLLRDVLTRYNDYDLCISEFVRVVDALQPDKVFHRLIPELHNGGKTRSGTPVRVQLLGQHPDWMAENAHRVVELGSPGIDLNFGCPAPTVNRSQGGAVLLKDPESLAKIVAAVRAAVPSHLPVSAKVRLGFSDKLRYLEIAQAAESAGATELTVHARTKEEGYRPPAHWEYLARIRENVNIPVIANGDIWDFATAQECQRVSGCERLMVGRGALSLPNLSQVIKINAPHLAWPEVLQLLIDYTHQELESEKALYYPARIKQFFSYLKREYPEAEALFAPLRLLHERSEIERLLQQQIVHLEKI